ncbi:MAG: hypothetical protein D6688_12350 [Alphaproteobacteria bacterium]|nr:MAG: hypothetical protein D6688_12350 [Alphaproteobacteria bacterium]
MSVLLSLFLTALGAGIGLVLATGPLGCFVVWRRMAFFGDAIAHAAILGIALSLAFSVSVVLGTLVVAAATAALLAFVSGRVLAVDTLLGVISHAALGLGVVAAAMVPGPRPSLETYLFGDILSVGGADLAMIWTGAAVVWGLLGWRWSALLLATLSRDLAVASGISVRRDGAVLMFTLALVVALAIKIVGALLISAMLVIPAAAARPFARTPEAMALLATLIGALSVAAGLGLSFLADTPAGPGIVVAAAAAFALSGLLRVVMRRP